jgi:hypothetical protein
MDFIQQEGDKALVMVEQDDPDYPYTRKALQRVPYAEVSGKVCDSCKLEIANGKCGCVWAVD